MEAGQYCTFAVHSSGSVWACGKGSYGRLGLGDSATQILPKRLQIDGVIKKISSSKGSDGHTIAVSEDGRIWSWGDGKFLIKSFTGVSLDAKDMLLKKEFSDKWCELNF